MKATMERFDAIVLGAGAAGLMCAMTAAQRGRRVLLLERANQVGKKILISGGGRCNFTNLDVRPERFLSGNPHFCKSALSRYRQQDFIALVEQHGIAYHEKTLGQLFCDGSARQIVDLLLTGCAKGGVTLRLNQDVQEISKPDDFHVVANGSLAAAPALVVATGGPSIPKMGATGFAYRLAEQFGVSLVPPRPALVPLTVESAGIGLEDPGSLAGLSLDCVARFGKAKFREAMLFTHRGLSGPAILQISSYWQPGNEIHLDLLPDIDAAAYLKARKQERPKSEARSVLSEIFPNRLAQTIALRHLPEGSLANLPDRSLESLGARLKNWPVQPTGSEGYAKAEVTAGGIDCRELSSKTFETRKVPGLYFIGEALDVTGWLGGYNFQWAWSSAWCCGQALTTHEG
ncbi:NAD(P)/FAD-dependent oxidoreductase [Limibacillus sp. MBR-115]|uniref:NAD(P)/FAD-dependent oxidoreductase n=1 Tax=Limibacillus sp. MBR-115 TaxID=3156465 RepID=UPI0033962A01